MNIGFDAKRAFCNTSGLGNYSRTVISAIHQFYPEESLFLFTPKKTSNSLLGSTGDSVVTPTDTLSKAFPSLWRSMWMKKDIVQNGVQVYHGLSNELPYHISKCKSQIADFRSVVTIHDLIFKRFPQYYPAVDRIIYDHKFKRSCVTADKIIAVSHQTKNDIIDFYKIAPEKIEVIYQSAGDYLRDDISNEEIERVKKKFHLPADYILSVGTVEERKNLFLVLKSLALLKSKLSIPLVVAGRATAYKRILQDYLSEVKMSEQVFFIDNISTEELQPLYAGAKLFVYPSRFEGFGIPVIEALHYGIPVVAAKGSCLEEAGGPSSKYINPDDENEMADIIEGILINASLQKEMREAGKYFVKKFNSAHFAHSLMTCYKSR